LGGTLCKIGSPLLSFLLCSLCTPLQTTLKKQIEKYADDIIKEANLIEEGIREDGASTEITSNIVLQAVRKNKTYHNKKSNKTLLITKIVSALSLLITGFLFDSSGYQNNGVDSFCYLSNCCFGINCITICF
jgi:hypothetical protein